MDKFLNFPSQKKPKKNNLFYNVCVITFYLNHLKKRALFPDVLKDSFVKT
jgi:hypothetical protein